MNRLVRSVLGLTDHVRTDRRVLHRRIRGKTTLQTGSIGLFAEFQLNIVASFAEFDCSIREKHQTQGTRAVQALGVHHGS